MIERRKLPDERRSFTKKISIARAEGQGLKLYVTAGMYDDGGLGELFIAADKVGSLAHGAFNAFAICLSVGLQYGVPLEAFLDKMTGMRFEPDGFTGDPEFPVCSSVVDLIARWLRVKFVKPS